MTLCPCRVSSNLSFLSQAIAYSDCCQPYHDSLLDDSSDKLDSIKAETAERLMRTRYSAFVLVKPEYIVKTTVPAQQSLLDVAAIEEWARQTPWAGLEIVRHTPKLGKRHAQVEFKAYFDTPDGQQAHHERSTFVKVKEESNNERWCFLDPTVAMTVSQKQPCICGSGEKFKRCCGGYLP
ncbi:YchJ family protein [Psychrobacter sp. 1Y11]|uniref:YchJ family protein n=1 Tax=Psychrobacter sp. 1Y11 TaxID=3457446 RepID=UPI003FCEFDFA